MGSLYYTKWRLSIENKLKKNLREKKEAQNFLRLEKEKDVKKTLKYEPRVGKKI